MGQKWYIPAGNSCIKITEYCAAVFKLSEPDAGLKRIYNIDKWMKFEYAGFYTNSGKFIPAEPTGYDYYLTKVYVVTEAGYTLQDHYSYLTPIWVPAMSILFHDCNGTRIGVKKAKPYKNIKKDGAVR